jgi:hypothetical protein
MCNVDMYVGGRMGSIGNAAALGLGTIGGIITIAIMIARIVITMMKTVTAIVGAITASGIGERAVEWLAFECTA